jgi:glycosyltransferase involved in cell wall biosynthesis
MVLAQAIPEILCAFPNALFLFPTQNADPVIQNQINSFLHEKRIKNVIWLPSQDRDEEIARYLNASKVAVSLASSDGTPKSVQEAMACEVPTIAGDIPSLRNWITPGRNGLLVALNDPHALAKAVISVLQAPDYGRKLGQQARVDIIERAEIRKTFAQYAALYASLTQGSR